MHSLGLQGTFSSLFVDNKIRIEKADFGGLGRFGVKDLGCKISG